MEFHDAANIFPMDEEHLDELAKDIKQNGQRYDIEVYNLKILDGRRRYLACGRADVKPRFKEVNPEDPVAYVLSLNLHRRHLNPSQLAMVGARAKDIYSKQAKERQKRKPLNSVKETLPEQKGQARDKAGKAVGVSGKLIDNASKVINEAVPELAAAVDQGRVSVSMAAKLADESKETQKHVASQAKFSAGRFRTPSSNGSTKSKKTKKSKSASPVFDYAQFGRLYKEMMAVFSEYGEYTSTANSESHLACNWALEKVETAWKSWKSKRK